MYFASAVLPLGGNLLLIGFALFSTCAIATHSSSRRVVWNPLTLAVVAFLCVMAISTMGSEDVGRSVRLSAPLLPAALLFVVMAAHSEGPRDVRLLYLVLSAISLGLSAIL